MLRRDLFSMAKQKLLIEHTQYRSEKKTYKIEIKIYIQRQMIETIVNNINIYTLHICIQNREQSSYKKRNETN